MDKSSKKGFSLVELLIVVVIIGVLVSLAVPQYNRFVAKARQSEAKASLSSLHTAMNGFFTEWNQYYGDFRAIGLSMVGDLRYDFGFISGGAGVPGHPNPNFQRTALAWATQMRSFCPSTLGANKSCEVLTDAVLRTSPSIKSGSHYAGTAAVVSASKFVGAAAGNLDNDSRTDQWSINQDKSFVHHVDDVSL